MASTISAGTTAGTAVAITGDTSGDLALLTQNGANTITVPNGTGTMAVNGVSSNIVVGTAVASTSGTSITFTSIPSWVKRVTVNFGEVSNNGAVAPQIQLGTSGGVQTTGYVGSVTYTGGVVTLPGTGFNLYANSSWGSASTISGSYVFTLLDSSNGTWICNGALGASNTAAVALTAGRKILSGTLDRVCITMDGTVAFDAGTINILYE